MTVKRVNRKGYTLRDISVNGVSYIKDESVNSDSRSLEAVSLITQIIMLSHKRGRTAKNKGEDDVS